MKGVFLRKKFNVRLFLLFACGLFFIGLYFFINIADPEVSSETLTLLIMGILVCLGVIPSWLLNLGAFIRIDKDSIKAKYHWFGKIDCKLSDVTFAVARVNTLIIQLKDGKTHTIMGVANSWPLASLIRRNMSFEITEQPEELMEKLNNLKSTKKKGLIYVCSGVALMFIIIFFTVFLTGEREMYEFSKIDWIIFAVMGVIELATVIATFYFAGKTGRKNVPIEKLNYNIRRTIIETKPIVYGYIIKVFTDYDCTGRIVVLGYPDDESVYYIMQEFASDYTLFKSYESEIYENMDDLLVDIGELIDITDKFN